MRYLLWGPRTNCPQPPLLLTDHVLRALHTVLFDSHGSWERKLIIVIFYICSTQELSQESTVRRGAKLKTKAIKQTLGPHKTYTQMFTGVLLIITQIVNPNGHQQGNGYIFAK